MNPVDLVSAIISFYSTLIIAYIIMSWFPLGAGLALDIYGVLGSICEPYVGLFRRIVPGMAVGGGGIDFSPLVAILVLQYLIRPVLVSLARMI